MERAVPAIMLVAASMLAAFRSGILSSAIFWTSALEIVATFSLFGVPDAFWSLQAFYDGDDEISLVSSSRVELLRELDNVHAMLAKCGTYGWSRGCLACRDL